ncbi:rho GTPase-activating protein gacO, partial [Arabidopsis lyrata subsp. lyrata]
MRPLSLRASATSPETQPLPHSLAVLSSTLSSNLRRNASAQPSTVRFPTSALTLTAHRPCSSPMPHARNIQTPPLTQCNAATGPAAPPPAPSPTENTPDVTLTPTSSPGARSGVRGGSKTIPSAGGGLSTGNVDRVPLHLLMFA